MTPAIVAAVYARKSQRARTGDDKTASVPRQVADAQAFATANGWLLPSEQVYDRDTAKSGAEFEKRDDLMRLLNAAKVSPRPFDILIVYDRDRLGREQIEVPYIIKQLVQLGVRVFETKAGGARDYPGLARRQDDPQRDGVCR